MLLSQSAAVSLMSLCCCPHGNTVKEMRAHDTRQVTYFHISQTPDRCPTVLTHCPRFHGGTARKYLFDLIKLAANPSSCSAVIVVESCAASPLVPDLHGNTTEQDARWCPLRDGLPQSLQLHYSSVSFMGVKH